MERNEKTNEDQPTFVSIRELAFLSGLGPYTVRRLVTLEVIEPDKSQPEPQFRVAIVERVRKMRRLHVELGVSWLSMPLVLNLLDRIEALEADRQPDED